MVGQNQIQRRLSQPDGVERVCQLLDENAGFSRTELADRLCDDFGFVDPRGRKQRGGCLKALRTLETRGRFDLPAPRTAPGPARPRRLESSVALPKRVPRTAGKIRGLELIKVETDEQMRVWNSLFLDEHPRGAGPLVGRQLRYLIGSDHGWLGGMGFASAALHLDARDRWIGWDYETRQIYLERLVGMSRFLIRPSVNCRNLASKVLGLAMSRMPEDFNERYGYKPWLAETFVDTSRFSGTCYRAANWLRVGASQGRGRQDREHKGSETIKDIYVYVLVEDFRARLGLSVHAGLGPLPLSTGLEADRWAKQEFGGAPLGDARLSQRLVKSACVQASNPMLSFPVAAEGDKALIKGHYRLIDQPDDTAATPENILLPHREQTIRRMKAQKTVLCIQDGTDLDYSGASECEGLGVIGTNQTGAKSLGLHLHSTFAVSDEGLPLGVLRGKCQSPTTKSKGDSRPASQVPVEEKDTYGWIQSMRDCEEVAAQMPHTRVMQVMDREADFFELFDHWRKGSRHTHLLVRAKHDRRLEKGQNASKLFDEVRKEKPCHKLKLYIDRQSARPKKSKQKARPKRTARVAQMALRCKQVQLPPPRGKGDLEPLSLWVVHMVEEKPPAGIKRIEWFLLTTMEVTTPRQAELLVEWYCLRWRIEDWHRVLKTGCKVEELRNESGERLKRALAIYLVIAWRVMLMTLLGREVPDLPAEVLFSELDLKVLAAYANKRRDAKPPKNLGEAVKLVAKLGGHMDRKSDPPPGHQAMWIGCVGLRYMCMGYVLHRDLE